MRKTVILAGLMAVSIAIAGCQSSHSTGTTSASAMSDKNKRWAKEVAEVSLSPEFERRAEEVGTQIGERIGELCVSASGAEARQACVRRYTLIAFDGSGLVGDHCPANDLSDDDCIALAGVSFDLARRVGGDTLRRFRWDDLKGSAEAAMAELVRQQVERCLASGSASDPKACVADGLSKALGLTKEDMKPCEAYDDDEAFNDCLGEVYGLSLMEDGLARLQELNA